MKKMRYRGQMPRVNHPLHPGTKIEQGGTIEVPDDFVLPAIWVDVTSKPSKKKGTNAEVEN